jgi:hypothetical protein
MTFVIIARMPEAIEYQIAHTVAHIASGALKVINGKDCYPNSIPVPRFGNKSVRQLIDDYQSKGNGTSK